MNTLKTALAVAALTMLTQAAFAGDCCCPSCGEKVCLVEVKEKKVKKHCYKVECKEICIPKITFCWPWQKNKAGCGGCGGAECAGCTAGCADGSCTDPGCRDGNCGAGRSGGAARCGKVKTVRVLKKVDYECKKCGYEWKIYNVGCGVAGCASGDCASGDCAAPGPVRMKLEDTPEAAEPPQPPATARAGSRPSVTPRTVAPRTVSFPR